MRRYIALLIALGLLAVAAACGSSGESTSSLPAGSIPVASTAPDAANFDGHVVDNPWYPLIPGMTWRYRGVKDGQPSREVMVATYRRRRSRAFRAPSSSDKLYLSGSARGAHTRLLRAGQGRQRLVLRGGHRRARTPTARSRARRARGLPVVDGAEAGIFMPADPRVGPKLPPGVLQGPGRGSFPHH